jgi:hypothetical protein
MGPKVLFQIDDFFIKPFGKITPIENIECIPFLQGKKKRGKLANNNIFKCSKIQVKKGKY